LQQGLGLLRGLIEHFWDTMYPEIEDGDLELRSAPLEWVGTRLDDPVRKAPLTRGGFSYYKFKESRSVGSEEDAAQSDQKREAREAAIADARSRSKSSRRIRRRRQRRATRSGSRRWTAAWNRSIPALALRRSSAITHLALLR